MQSINFEIGNYKKYAVNGDENNVIKIDVSDLAFVDRFKKAYSEIKEYTNEIENVTDPDENILVEMDAKTREIINKAFDEDVCQKAFGNKNCFSVATNGKPGLINFLEAFIPIIEQDFKSAFQAKQIKIEEKTDKYIKPVTEQYKPPIIGMVSQPAVDISKLTQEQKNAMLMELLK